MMQPVGVESYIGHSYESAKRLLKTLALDDFAHRGAAVTDTQVGIERGLPHGHKKHHMSLLAGTGHRSDWTTGELRGGFRRISSLDVWKPAAIDQGAVRSEEHTSELQ